MKNRVFKVSVILAIILTMTMSNFILVGNSFISYAIDSIATNHQNVEFKAYFKDKEGNEVTTLEKTLEEEDPFLYLRINVKKEGYFNGEITLDSGNFTLKTSDSAYVNKIENNTIYLNQINVGASEEIKVEIEPIKEEDFTIGLLNMTSKISIKGIYRDSTQKDITIQSSRDLKMELMENNTSDNVLNEMQVITNKIIEIDGQEKRMLQFSYQIGLKENNYPMKEIQSKISVPAIDGKQAEVAKVIYLNNMTAFDYQYDGSNVTLTFRNEPDKNEKVMWKMQGSENVILTCLYDKEAKVENLVMNSEEKVILYNNKEISAEKEITVGKDELDSVIEVSAKNVEESMYKGKIYSGIDRQYQSSTQLKINFAKAIQNIVVSENASQYVVGEAQQEANVIYNKTMIQKEQFDKLFGKDGAITIYNQNGEVLEKITNATPINQEGNILIDYEGKEVKEIRIQTTAPVEEGILEFNHVKTIKNNGDIVKDASALKNEIVAAYNSDNIGATKEIETSIQLENTTTKATLEMNKESLSTVVVNHVEMKAVLISNNEKYDLYKNPTITITLPEDVEKIDLTKVEMLYEEEMKIKTYRVEGKSIIVELEGEQTAYQNETVKGANIIINADITLNKKAASKEAKIQMTYTNQKASQEIEDIVTSIKVVAPTEVTTIYQIPELGIEAIGEEENKMATLAVGKEEKQLESYIEIINNKSNAIRGVTVLGVFPTANQENTMDTSIVEGIKVEGIENAKIYYTQNEEATGDLTNTENGWTETIIDATKVKKYLIYVDKMETQARIIATYKTQVPANLEYNQTAKQRYEVSYTDSETGIANTIKSTEIKMQTGVGPRIEVALSGKVGTENLGNGAKVKAGEVIKYAVEIANTGSEEIENAKIVAPVPEGTTYVEAKQNYEYTGSVYYQEIKKENYEDTIETLKPGQKVIKEYEVRVNKDITTGTTIKNVAEVTTGELIKKTNELQMIGEAGDIRVSVKRITDRRASLYSLSSIEYYVMIENISSEDKNDVKVQSFLPDEFEVKNVSLITGLKEKDVTEENMVDADSNETSKKQETDETPEEVKIEDLQYKKEMNIGTLKKEETKVLYYEAVIQPVKEQKNVNYYAVVKQGQNSYRSNVWIETVNSYNMTIQMISDTKSQYVKAGEMIEYSIYAKNESEAVIDGAKIIDNIPTQCTIQSIEKDGVEIELPESNQINLVTSLQAGEGTHIKVKAIVNESEARTEPEQIMNQAMLTMNGDTIGQSDKIIHIIEASEEGKQSENGNGNGNQTEDNNYANGNKIISGVAWYDENKNGKKEKDEKTLSNIKVTLLNVETNQLVKTKDGKVLEATTNDSGIYMLSNIANGKYIVIFDYDNSQYVVTKYKVAGLVEEENSNAIVNELFIENEKKQVASTDILEVKDNNISNINIGFFQLENFDLKLDKYISRILIQNANGTTVREYNDATMAKVELDAKQIKGSTVIIEYKIKVTNNGEAEGYAKKIVDYASTDLKFSSELNKDWYQVGNTLYTASLANEKIKPGETKTVTLTLTKAMTENNVGLIPNVAEIAEDYNELGLKDVNSTPGNRKNGENDMATAEAIISIRTGGIWLYSMISLMMIAVLSVIVVPVVKKKNKSKKKILDKV